jgi:hypothetical protein
VALAMVHHEHEARIKGIPGDRLADTQSDLHPASLAPLTSV